MTIDFYDTFYKELISYEYNVAFISKDTSIEEISKEEFEAMIPKFQTKGKEIYLVNNDTTSK